MNVTAAIGILDEELKKARLQHETSVAYIVAHPEHRGMREQAAHQLHHIAQIERGLMVLERENDDT